MLLALAQVDLREKLNIPHLKSYLIHKNCKVQEKSGFTVAFFALKSESNSAAIEGFIKNILLSL